MIPYSKSSFLQYYIILVLIRYAIMMQCDHHSHYSNTVIANLGRMLRLRLLDLLDFKYRKAVLEVLESSKAVCSYYSDFVVLI